MYKFEFSLLYTHIDFHRTETDLLFLSGRVNGASLRNGPVFHIFPWINGSWLKYEKLLCFPSLKQCPFVPLMDQHLPVWN